MVFQLYHCSLYMPQIGLLNAHFALHGMLIYIFFKNVCSLFPAPPKEEKQSEKEQKKEAETEKPPEKPSPAPATPVKVKKKAPITRSAKVSSKDKKPSHPHSSSKSSKKPVTPPNKMAVKSKKPGQSTVQPPSPFPPGPIHVTGALRVTKSNFTIPKKQPLQKDAASESQSSSRVPSSPVSSAPSGHSSSRLPHSTSSASPMPPPPNNQMRQNIRRSLTDIIYKR